MERSSGKPRAAKLGLRPGARVAILGVDDPDLPGELALFTGDVTNGLPGASTDLVFLAADAPADLAVLPELRACLRPDGAVWVVSRKGRAATLRDVEVMAAARSAGLVDNKVVAFSGTHTALRLVIPRAARPARPGQRGPSPPGARAGHDRSDQIDVRDDDGDGVRIVLE